MGERRVSTDGAKAEPARARRTLAPFDLFANKTAKRPGLDLNRLATLLSVDGVEHANP